MLFYSMLKTPPAARRDTDATQDIVDAIVKELKRGPLNDPRIVEFGKNWGVDGPPIPNEQDRDEEGKPQRSALDKFLEEEIYYSIDRVRRRDWPGVPTMAEVRAAKRALDKFDDKHMRELQTVRAWLARLAKGKRWPADRMDAAKYAQAAEAYYIIEMFSKDAPTGFENGPFRIIAEYLHEAVTGVHEATMQRACAQVLKDRRPN